MKINKARDNYKIALYPSRMEVVINENCNLDCDYCCIDRSAPGSLDFDSIKKAMDIFLDFSCKDQFVTFSAYESLILPEVYKKTISYILSKGRELKKEIKIFSVTNGINLNKKIRKFIIEKINLNKDFWINISLDGRKESHDAHRFLKYSKKDSAFKLAWKNFQFLPQDKIYVSMTIVKSELPLFTENIHFLLKNGVRNLDICPQLGVLWSNSELKILKKELIRLINYFKKSKNKYNLKLLNRVWINPCSFNLLFGCDKKFYLFDCVVTIPYHKRKPYIIGDLERGIDLKKRQMLFEKLYEESRQGFEKCGRCAYNGLCSYPLQLFLFCKYSNKDFKKYFQNYCKITKMLIDLQQKFDGRVSELKKEKRQIPRSKFI